MLKKERLLKAGIALIILNILGIPIVYGATSLNTIVNQSINSGALTLTVNLNEELPFTPIQGSSDLQKTTAILTAVNVSDERGTGPGWSSTLAAENLTLTKTPFADPSNTGPNINLNSSSRYDGTCGVGTAPTFYEINITTTGSVGTATYSVTGGCADENQTNRLSTATNNPVGTRGILVDFPEGTYSIGDKWTILVDVYPFTGLKVIPQAPTAAIEGSDLTGVSENSATFLSGSGANSSATDLLTAGPDKGMGSYNQDIHLELNIHGNSLSGTYNGKLTLSVS